MIYDYNIIVIGAGSAGLVVASGASSLGAKVALIEGEKMGGDCLNYGCVPSKTLLRSAHLVSDVNSSNKLGLNITIDNVDLAPVMERVNEVIKRIEPHDSIERYESLGVDVYSEYGKFIDEHTINIDGKTITGEKIVIATGSNPNIPPIKGLNEVKYYTNRDIFTLKVLPKHLIVLGAGAISVELGQAFKHLGSEVTIINRSNNIFKKDDQEVSEIMKNVLLNDGVNLELSSSVKEIKSKDDEITVTIDKKGITSNIKGDCLLVSLGRVANIKNLNLDTVGVKLTDRNLIKTNKHLQTNVKNIYACGDVVGPYHFTHMAGYQASIVIQNTIFPIKKSVKYNVVPWTTYTKPEVAHVGYTEDFAKKNGTFYKKYIVSLDSNDRANTDEDLDGFLKLIVNKKNVLIGATLVSNKAGDQISIATLMIQKKLKLNSFLSMNFSYPTESEIFKTAALLSLKESFKPWHKKLIKLFIKKTTN